MQEVTNKYQSFKSSVRSLNTFLNDLPSNKILSVDTMSEITAKLNSQKVRLVKNIIRYLRVSAEGNVGEFFLRQEV